MCSLTTQWNMMIKGPWLPDRKSTRLNSSHTEIYTLSLHDALPILKNSEEYRGSMVNIDPYMNVFLDDAVEYDDKGSMVTNYGQVVIRGNNVLFVILEEALKA